MFRFGLDRLALILTRHPATIGLTAVTLTLMSIFLMVTGTQFTGDITENLRKDSAAYSSFKDMEQNFHTFSKDERILLRSTDLSNPEIYAKLQDFLLELQFASQVEAAFSIFSLPAITDQTDDQTGGSAFFLTHPTQLQKSERERLVSLRSTVPIAEKMLSRDLKATIIILMLSDEAGNPNRGLSSKNLQEIKDLATGYKDAFTLSFVGIPEIQRTIRTNLYADQTQLTITSTLLCLLFARLLFRSWRSALVCAAPPVIGMCLYFGFLASFSIPVDFLTTIVPTMVIVIAFADGVHLFMSMQRAWADGKTKEEGLVYGIRTTGPACLLASLTTSLAFIGIGFGGTDTMYRLATTGAVGIMLAFLSVIVVLPILAHYLIKLEGTNEHTAWHILKTPARPAQWLVKNGQKLVLILSGAATIGLIAIHLNLPASFRVTDYISEKLPVRLDEIFIENNMGGSGQLFAIIQDPDGARGISDQDADEIANIARSLNQTISVPIKIEPIAKLLKLSDQQDFDADNIFLNRFVSKDGLSYITPLPLGTMLAAQDINDYVDRIDTQLAADGWQEKVQLTGLSHLIAKEVPKLIEDLRTGLIGAIVIVILATMIIIRSVRVGLAFIVPNLVPILTVEAYFWFIDEPLSMTAVIALTIAFGIAVDNSVHLLNQFRLAQEENLKLDPVEAMCAAIHKVTPAVLVTLLLLVAGLSMTQLSALPSVMLFGRLVITALFVALLADLFILPSFLIAFERKKE